MTLIKQISTKQFNDTLNINKKCQLKKRFMQFLHNLFFYTRLFLCYKDILHLYKQKNTLFIVTRPFFINFCVCCSITYQFTILMVSFNFLCSRTCFCFYLFNSFSSPASKIRLTIVSLILDKYSLIFSFVYNNK